MNATHKINKFPKKCIVLDGVARVGDKRLVPKVFKDMVRFIYIESIEANNMNP